MVIFLDDFFKQHPNKIFDEKYLKKYLMQEFNIKPIFMNVFHDFLYVEKGFAFYGDSKKRVLEQMKDKGFDCKNTKNLIKKHFFTNII